MLRFIDSLKIFSSGFFIGSYTYVIISTSKPSWPGALFHLNDLNASWNSFSFNTVSSNAVFTFERYNSKVGLHWRISLAIHLELKLVSFGPVLIKYLFIYLFQFIYQLLDI